MLKPQRINQITMSLEINICIHPEEYLMIERWALYSNFISIWIWNRYPVHLCDVLHINTHDRIHNIFFYAAWITTFFKRYVDGNPLVLSVTIVLYRIQNNIYNCKLKLISCYKCTHAKHTQAITEIRPTHILVYFF